MTNILFTALVSFASAGFGALAAFQLQDAKDKRKEFNRNRKAVNRALFDLSLKKPGQRAILSNISEKCSVTRVIREMR